MDQDIERTNAIGEALAGAVQLSSDTNQGWNRDEAVSFARGASSVLDFLEQPLHGHDVEGMAMIAGEASCPIAADEGLHSFDDVRRHHAMGAAQGGSVKMIKLGGVTRAHQATKLFDELGMHVNIAGKIAESSVSSSAVLQLGAAAPSIEWGTSCTCQFLKTDIARNPVQVIDGRAKVPAGAGLGIDVDEDALAEFAR